MLLKCKMCGGDIQVSGEGFGTCDSCGTVSTLPKIDDQKRANLFNRANYFRMQNDFDKALRAYENLIEEDDLDPEAHWGLVLSRYGIEYVLDPATGKRLPTCHRVQSQSILSDYDYLQAIKNAPNQSSRDLYQQQAQEIYAIQKEILSISNTEEPVDVFICYKETGEDKQRTKDSVLAQDIYYQLTNAGFAVFFSKISLEKKLGKEYEPYIFAALKSAKVMLVIGTKPEYFQSVWVKNEWSRYLAMMKDDPQKLIIPCYGQMDAYDLPEELSLFQAQDMSKIGFVQDLIHGIKKVGAENLATDVASEQKADASATSLLERAFLFLEDGDFASADEYCEKVLDINPKMGQAYLAKLMAERGVKNKDLLGGCETPLDTSNNYQKALRFADQQLKTELDLYLTQSKKASEQAQLQAIYDQAKQQMSQAKTQTQFDNAAALFCDAGSYQDSQALMQHCVAQAKICQENERYQRAKTLVEELATGKTELGLYDLNADWQALVGEYSQLADQVDAIKKQQIAQRQAQQEKQRLAHKKRKTMRTALVAGFLAVTVGGYGLIFVLNTMVFPAQKYAKAMYFYNDKQYENACAQFGLLGDYKDAKNYVKELNINFSARLSAGECQSVAVKSNGKVLSTTKQKTSKQLIKEWCDVVAVSAGSDHAVAVKADGSAVAVGDDQYGQCGVGDWSDIVQIAAADHHTVGLRSDGTVVAVGDNQYGQCDVGAWRDIVAICAGKQHTVGLRSDGTVVAVGGLIGVDAVISDWRGIVAISAGELHIVALKEDGTVVAAGSNYYSQCSVGDWRDIVAVSAGYRHTVAIKKDGTVTSVGNGDYGQREMSRWKNVVAVSASLENTVGVLADGTVVSTKYIEGDKYYFGQCDVDGWKLW